VPLLGAERFEVIILWLDRCHRVAGCSQLFDQCINSMWKDLRSSTMERWCWIFRRI
jgi:hypothetical protein